MLERVLIAGSGGQGVLLVGKVLAGVAARSVPHVTFYPAYGAEVRGGTSHCEVILSSEEIASPEADAFDWMLLMNQASADRFSRRLAEGGRMIVNASMCAVPSAQAGLVAVPASGEADALGNVRAANFVMLGAFAACSRLVSVEDVSAEAAAMLEGKSTELLRLNLAALRRGEALAAACAQDACGAAAPRPASPRAGPRRSRR